MPPDLYQAIGGMDTCRKLSSAFYARVGKDPLLRPLFPSSFHCAIPGFALFLAQFLGGPCQYSELRWWLSLRDAHLRFKIGTRERNAWLKLMGKALDDAQIAEPERGALRGFFEASSAYLINQPPAPADAPAPLNGEMAQRWEAQLALEECVAAVRRHDVERAFALADSPAVQGCIMRDRAALPSLLAVMSSSGNEALLDYVRRKLTADPELVRERYTNGRTLLHDAADAGDSAVVELLLQLGADANAVDLGGHAPLYGVGNACKAASCAGVIRALVRGGANVHAQDGVQRCTALHMAARRGNVAVAEALLDCGADIEARDRGGDTPLRRAVNCRKKEMVHFLLSRGATEA
jgi:truncated hemoglobin YjbI